MASYTQASTGQPPFPWRSFLDQTYHTDAEWEQACTAARDWPTCACGSMDAEIERTSLGAPRDTYLHQLGVQFTMNVSRADLEQARLWFGLIEARAAELIAQARATPSP